MKTLEELYQEHKGKSSDKWEIYLSSYERFFTGFRSEPINLFEIGVQNGGSLEIWGKYFGQAKHLLGCDINESCKDLVYDDPRIQVVVGDANADITNQRLLEICSRYDIIIDDGSHTSADIIRSFSRYFPNLNDGGLYLAEDLHCSYWQEYEGGLYSPYSSIEFFKKLADIINHEHWGNGKSREGFLRNFELKYGVSFDGGMLDSIHSVEFVNSICVIRKEISTANRLGRRIVVGDDESVVPGISELARQSFVPPDQSQNKWSFLECSPAESWHSTIEKLKTCTLVKDGMLDEIAVLKKQLVDLTEECDNLMSDRSVLSDQVSELSARAHDLSFSLSAIHSSTSWRVTSPLRSVMGMVDKPVKIFGLGRSLVRTYGARETIRKAVEILKQEGAAGLLSRINVSQSPDAHECEYINWYNNRYEREGISESYLTPFDVESMPLISILMPVFKPDPKYFEQAIESVVNQSYSNWELCIVDDSSKDTRISELLSTYSKLDQRIKHKTHNSNQHISASSNTALQMAEGEYVVLLDHDDLLPSHSLMILASVILENPEVEFFYSDEDRLDRNGSLCRPFFKPDWSPELLLSQNYITHLACFSRSLADNVGGFREGYEGAQDHDLFLRLTNAAKAVKHIPEILYHWREHVNSTSINASSKPYAHEAGLKAIGDFLTSTRSGNFSGYVDSSYTFTYSPRFSLGDDVHVSIIIPTRDRVDLLGACVDSIVRLSTWNNYEIVIVDNGSTDKDTLDYFEEIKQRDNVIVVSADFKFNWSKVNNLGASRASGNVFVFLNNDIEVISPDWIERLAGYAILPDIAAVGPLLLYENGLIQHAGVVVGMNGWADHVYKALPPEHHTGPFVSPMVTRNVLAVTGACTVIEANKYHDLGGYDERFIVCGSDVELCLRAYKAGYRNVYTPDAKLYHYESMSRSSFVPENDFKLSEIKYAPYRKEQIDPFFNIHCDLSHSTPRMK